MNERTKERKKQSKKQTLIKHSSSELFSRSKCEHLIPLYTMAEVIRKYLANFEYLQMCNEYNPKPSTHLAVN